MMAETQISNYSTLFRQLLAIFCLFASPQLRKNLNRIQREFDSNVAIATQEFSSASKQLRQKTNFSKQSTFSLPCP
jgi:hypothetical protein